jgi:integrase
MIDEIVDRGHKGAAHQTLTVGRSLHSWAIERGVYGIEVSPFDRIKANKLIGKQEPRQRLLSPAELSLIWRAAKDSPTPEGEYVRLLLLLGLRRNELADAAWVELALDGASWIIPGPRMKNKAPHLMPLPAAGRSPRAAQATCQTSRVPRRGEAGDVPARLVKPRDDAAAMNGRSDSLDLE